MTAVIYARYSSDNQREESIEGQIRECTAYAEKNGITVIKHYIDRALSAKTDIARFFQRFAEYIPEMGGIAGQAGLGAFPDELVGGIPQLDGARADIQRHRNIPDIQF